MQKQINKRFYSQNNKCNLCEKLITNKATYCKICFAIINYISSPLSNIKFGENAPNYKHGKSCKNKKYYCIDCGKEISKSSGIYGKGRCGSCATKKLKTKIRNRDSYMCQLCGNTTKDSLELFGRNLDVHHIDYNKENLNFKNLISLCPSCHMKSNTNRDYWFAYYTYITENCLNCNLWNECIFKDKCLLK
jgi:hypothetical protein